MTQPAGCRQRLRIANDVTLTPRIRQVLTGTLVADDRHDRDKAEAGLPHGLADHPALDG